jgi:hypothetical protein
MTTLNSPQAPALRRRTQTEGLIMDSGPRRDTLSFLGVVFSASIVVAAALPRSPATPLISAFILVAVLLMLTPFLSRSVWRGLGLNRAGLRLCRRRSPMRPETPCWPLLRRPHSRPLQFRWLTSPAKAAGRLPP